MPLPNTFTLLVLGQGSTGLDVVAWALEHTERVLSVTVYGGGSSEPTEATRALEERGVRFEYGTEKVEGAFDICVASPGISEFSDFFAAGAAHASEIMGEPEFAWRLSSASWCAITGTNGKTTTTTLVHHVLDVAGIPNAAVGNIGTPTIDAVDTCRAGSWMVAELSSYQIATTAELHPRVAMLLNITPDHLAWHRTHENYAKAKIKLFQNMDERDLAIVDVEDEGVMAYADDIFTSGRRVLSLGLADAAGADAAFVRDGMLVVRLAGEETELVAARDLALAGSHNITNVLAAAAASLFIGATPAQVRSAVTSFMPLEHRVEPAGEIDGVRYYNDSKATNTDAVEKALTAFPDDDVILLLGGHDKGTPLEDFAAFVCEHVRAVVCFGEARERFRHAIEDADRNQDVDIAEADDMCDAVDVARSLAARGDVVLLSPACSSFDEFSGFEERGCRFKEYVEELRLAGEADALDRA
ncbi:UDP-N-acetylmuramoyl-L-alanine--D-glutamate ligase [Collinsella tanakaei]|uniref:UDP-N-acetylmuramoyl-L-alanine--D-glutamate ligase n=1 Tax=Collinsella tanakaei TaxID=626935 RepID=UPI00195D086B|nr:UDP-N-acetylmuramoyl-L-alanine--D-glutamate ligase [Collinsella tanakaei]MBM6755253.1 UDP-N-acetylmuramoyl-L-alanine--D-glutamate ligase [Collinsella tanakaei]